MYLVDIFLVSLDDKLIAILSGDDQPLELNILSKKAFFVLPNESFKSKR